MLRQAVFTSARAASRWSCARATPIARSNIVARSVVFPSRQQLAFQGVRCYAASAGLSKDEVQGRILDLLKNFDKVCGGNGCIWLMDMQQLTRMTQVTDASKVHRLGT